MDLLLVLFAACLSLILLAWSEQDYLEFGRPFREIWPHVFLFACFSIGAVLVAALIAVNVRPTHAAAPVNVVCETDSFDAVEDPANPSLREQAVCHMGDVNGPAVTVFLLDRTGAVCTTDTDCAEWEVRNGIPEAERCYGAPCPATKAVTR